MLLMISRSIDEGSRVGSIKTGHYAVTRRSKDSSSEMNHSSNIGRSSLDFIEVTAQMPPVVDQFLTLSLITISGPFVGLRVGLDN